MQVVWFKRDLRIVDHQPLFEAAQAGKVLPLYILEPELWQQADMSHRHFAFLKESLHDLNRDLLLLGQRLVIRIGDAIEVLEAIDKSHGIDALLSHQETWNDWTYQRDKRVKKWLHRKNIPWREARQNGVIRCLTDRNAWGRSWNTFMNQPIVQSPSHLSSIDIDSDPLPSSTQLNLAEDSCKQRQVGGRKHAIQTLQSFLAERGEHYYFKLSSPLTAIGACSRLSAHIAFGNLSLREIYQAVNKKMTHLRSHHDSKNQYWQRSLTAYLSRLRWHCHFIQKLEDEPRLEFENAHRLYDGLRLETPNPVLFNAWCEGRTGYPLVDACMRSLIATGWLNFRMRAMLMSFASYHLWLDWREPSLHLARLFTDYEPGIHYNQCQMQSGTTGINAIRVYNPIKQSIDQDPKGIFIKRWVPELRSVPVEYIHQPWLVDEIHLEYPAPIVAEAETRKESIRRILEVRNHPKHQQQAEVILTKHGSRKRQQKKKSDSPQLVLPLS